MSTLVRTTGYNAAGDASSYSTRMAFTLSNGNALVVIRDPNAAAALFGEHNNTNKVYVYESVDRVTWTLRTTITAPNTTGKVTAALFPDNSVAIWHMNSAAQIVHYCKVAYSTYTASAWELIATAGAGVAYRRFDGCVTDSNTPIVALFEDQGNAVVTRIYTKRSSDNAWVLTMSQTESNNGYSTDASAITIAALGGSSASRAVVYAVGDGAPNGAPDYGIDLYTLNIVETTGATGTAQVMRANYWAGEVDNTLARGQGREIKLFRTGTDEYTLAAMHAEVNKRFGIVRGTYSVATWTTTLPLAQSYTGTSTSNLGDRAMAITASNDQFIFYYTVKNGNGTGHYQIADYVVRVDRIVGTVRFAPGRGWWNDAKNTSDTLNVYGGGDRNLALSKFDTIQFISVNNPNNQMQHMYASPGTLAPINQTPANAATFTTSNPSLAVKADTNRAEKQTQIKIEWQFAKDSIFTTNLITYTQDDSHYADVVGTSKSGVTVTYNDTLSMLYTLSQGTWYVRARLVDEVEQRGIWSAATTVIISHPPSATNLTPASSVQLVFADGSRPFAWTFSDPSASDYQTAFQIIIERNDTGATVLDTGKVVSLANNTIQTVSATYKDLLLQWKVRVWDRDDVAGAYSDYALFKLADPPGIAINTPVLAGVITSGVPSVQFTLTTGGGRVVTSYTVTMTQGSKVVWSATKTNLSLPTGSVITEVGDRSYLENLSGYTVSVTATDNSGVTGNATAVPFSTSWVTPAAPSGLTVDTSQYNVEDAGYVQVSWTDVGRDADFNGWILYRRDNLIDPRTNTVVQFGSWKMIYIEYNTGTSYVYRDYLAPSQYQVDYRVTQQVNRFGDSVESSNLGFVSAVPVSDGYWLVTPAIGDVAASAYRLANITADSYTDEWESETYTVIGSGRHVDKGDRLGWNGQIDAQLRDSATQTARQKKLRIDTIKRQSAQLWLRNPFGDTFPVSVGDISVSRIAGTGKSEFVDVSLPYSEVAV